MVKMNFNRTTLWDKAASCKKYFLEGECGARVALRVEMMKIKGLRQVVSRNFTRLFTLVYSFLFVKAGYVISTFLFVGFELVLFSGTKKWKSCSVIALSFSLVIYILFSKMLGVYLPVTPFIWI